MMVQVMIKRKERKLKQADVAKMLHISKQTYHLKETGKSEFTITEGKRLAKIFDCTLNDLFWEENKNAEQVVDSETFRRQGTRIVVKRV